MFWTIIGFLAASLTMLSFIPQVAKALKTRSVRDISPITLFQLSAGVALWILYGVHIGDPIVIMANIVTIISLITLIFLYYYFGSHKAQQGGDR